MSWKDPDHFDEQWLDAPDLQPRWSVSDYFESGPECILTIMHGWMYKGKVDKDDRLRWEIMSHMLRKTD